MFKTNLSRFSCSNHVCFRGGKPLATPLSFGFLMDVPYMAIGVVGMMMFISSGWGQGVFFIKFLHVFDI